MKVLHVCETVKGGVGSYLNELIPAQERDMGLKNIELLVPASHAEFLDKVNDSSIRTFHRASRKAGLLKLATSYIKTMREERPDVVHAHSTFAGLIVRALRPFFPRTPIIYCPHGWAMDMEQPALRKKIIKILEWALSHLCEKIICISEYEKKVAIEAGIAEKKCVTIYNGISPDIPPLPAIEWNDDARLKVLFVGRFDRQKGIDILVEACAPIQDQISLKLIGDAVSGDEVIDIEKFSFADRLGWLEHHEVTAWIGQCDVLIVPSRWEGFGLVAIEAMRMARPVIASKVGGLGELLEDNVSGIYVLPNDSSALRAAIESFDKEASKTMGLAAKKRFEEHFKSQQMIEKIASLYTELSP